MPEQTTKKKCFVVMGFGKKTDFQQQKVFDLDKSYRIIIKRAVESAGLECIRADDVVHAGVIDKPMYELLLGADVVVADLSTANANAIYELGVRHALRPHTTIVIAESAFKFPFDISHLMVRPYKHMGEGIDAEEAEMFRDKLTAAIKELAGKGEPDSPVYTFLPDLRQPVLGAQKVSVSEVAKSAAPPDDQTASVLMEMSRTARAAGNWGAAKLALRELIKKMPQDPYVIQQLALATYKDKGSDAHRALEAAKEILRPLAPERSKDPETLGLWGAIHKRLWERDGSLQALNASVDAYGMGFYLKDDPYNGINYAFMLDARASVSDEQDRTADRVWAKRVRQRVIENCEALFEAGVRDDEGRVDPEQTFWVQATLVEALVGTGQDARAEAVRAEAVRHAPESWMADSLEEQLGKLRTFMQAPPPG